MNGKCRRISRIFNNDGKTIIIPVDDSLIFGPFSGLNNLQKKINDIILGNPDAILSHPGMFKNELSTSKVGRIINVSASTVNNQHTRKVIVSSVESAIYHDADCIASHINVTSEYEQEMLSMFGQLVADSEKYAIPVLAISYPRRVNSNGSEDNYLDLKAENPKKYTDLLCHCVRIARDLGADIIKTQYSGDIESFVRVIEAASPVPVVIAGGALINAIDILNIAENALMCGCKGISFGRNVFSRKDSKSMVNALSDIVHGGVSAKVAYASHYPLDERDLYENLE